MEKFAKFSFFSEKEITSYGFKTRTDVYCMLDASFCFLNTKKLIVLTRKRKLRRERRIQT